MKKCLIPILACLICVSNITYALSTSIQRKYPHTLLTKDYGILNDSDLLEYNSRSEVGVNAWQCFPTSAVSVSYSNLGFDPDLKLNFAELKIKIRPKENVIHEYEMKRGLPVGDCKDMKTIWMNLMKKEKYVCIGGNFVDLMEKKHHGSKQKIAGWIFDKIKTAKGCDAFYKNCSNK